jgi:N-methylhydantoinase B/oxoprolinase/acetone carboxylase alpha subunit
LARVDTQETICVGNAGAIGPQATRGGKLAHLGDRGQRVAGGERDEGGALVGEKWLGVDKQCCHLLLDEGGKGRIDFTGGAGFGDHQV